MRLSAFSRDSLGGVDHGRIEANEVSFAYLEEGPRNGPLAICLHGFPDSAHTWEALLVALGSAGYHAIAPFMRGYAPTSVPKDSQYQIGALVRDVNTLHELFAGRSDSVLIGHDWGALTTYGALAHRPDFWRAAVTASVPPVASVMSSLFSYDQLKRSWYTFFFQSPLAETAICNDNYSFLDRLWADWSPGLDATSHVTRAKESIATPERIRAAISYYRALYSSELHDPALAREQAASVAPAPVPVLYLHGESDGCISIDAVDNPLKHLPQGSRMEIVEGAGHFLHLERPTEVNKLIIDFLDNP
ncbi:MAG: alpha/beta hydrolase [Actinobacteria bacterium]|jgi:pimeloyl-ACP methyl ester carboxylesterase|nr:alpha/beta hydrolase [Actinomycetota bacterium]